jgi:hypothetical protein
MRQTLYAAVVSAAAITMALGVGAPPAAGKSGSVTGARLAAGSVVLATTGSLTFAGELQGKYPPTSCPAGSPSTLECFARIGRGIIRGLGSVEESYAYTVEGLPGGCPPEPVRVLPTTVRLSIAGKGEIEIRLPGTGCLSRVSPTPLEAKETFTILGGSGRYTGASGSGTLAHVSYGPSAWRATDTWTGTLVVPGLEFDLTAPTITGAANKLVRVRSGVKRVRVTYAVTAQDDVDAGIPTTCLPRSRSWFKVGRTPVLCTATDTSGNVSRARFVVAVR